MKQDRLPVYWQAKREQKMDNRSKALEEAGKFLGTRTRNEALLELVKLQEYVETYSWTKEIPFLDFDANWLIKPTPSIFSGAVQFFLIHREIENYHVSVSMNYHDAWPDDPSWVVHALDGDITKLTWRNLHLSHNEKHHFDLTSVKGLIKHIGQLFDEQRKKNKGTENG